MLFLALGLQPGDEIIVPGFGFMAAANVALGMGLSPRFAEVDRDTWCINPEEVQLQISRRTKCIVAVHTYGNVCDMEGLIKVAAGAGIPLVEDGAESLGSSYLGRGAGSVGVAGTLSFQATKTITTGEGGMVVTNDDLLASRLRLFRNHGMSHTRYMHDVPGQNFRLTNMQAAIGCAQMENIDRILVERKRVYERYANLLTCEEGVTFQNFKPEVSPVVWAVAVRLDPMSFPQGRDTVMGQMLDLGVETRPGFYAASQIPIYETTTLPISAEIARSVVSFPSFPTLNDVQVEEICTKLISLRRPGLC
jgi:perosamine synthetase